jgi:proteasome lid subunit RPN8/RPN11
MKDPEFSVGPSPFLCAPRGLVSSAPLRSPSARGEPTQRDLSRLSREALEKKVSGESLIGERSSRSRVTIKTRKQNRVEHRHLRSVIMKAAETAKQSGREIAGLLVDNGYCLELIECRNKARSNGALAFYADEVRAIAKSAERLGHEVCGTFHSHPIAPGIPGNTTSTMQSMIP